MDSIAITAMISVVTRARVSLKAQASGPGSPPDAPAQITAGLLEAGSVLHKLEADLHALKIVADLRIDTVAQEIPVSHLPPKKRKPRTTKPKPAK